MDSCEDAARSALACEALTSPLQQRIQNLLLPVQQLIGMSFSLNYSAHPGFSDFKQEEHVINFPLQHNGFIACWCNIQYFSLADALVDARQREERYQHHRPGQAESQHARSVRRDLIYCTDKSAASVGPHLLSLSKFSLPQRVGLLYCDLVAYVVSS